MANQGYMPTSSGQRALAGLSYEAETSGPCLVVRGSHKCVACWHAFQTCNDMHRVAGPSGFATWTHYALPERKVQQLLCNLLLCTLWIASCRWHVHHSLRGWQDQVYQARRADRPRHRRQGLFQDTYVRRGESMGLFQCWHEPQIAEQNHAANIDGRTAICSNPLAR
jgi:hypothetical protein